MRIFSLVRDTQGATAVEFGLTAPVFFLMLIAAIEVGLLFWTQLGLQHGAEMAARCASVNSTICSSVSAIQNYAANQSLGLQPPSSTFSVESPPCGNQVTASYQFVAIASYFGIPALTLSAKSCFPR
jgi:Flp pilus assembly protein TadG